MCHSGSLVNAAACRPRPTIGTHFFCKWTELALLRWLFSVGTSQLVGSTRKHSENTEALVKRNGSLCLKACAVETVINLSYLSWSSTAYIHSMWLNHIESWTKGYQRTAISQCMFHWTWLWWGWRVWTPCPCRLWTRLGKLETQTYTWDPIPTHQLDDEWYWHGLICTSRYSSSHPNGWWTNSLTT